METALAFCNLEDYVVSCNKIPFSSQLLFKFPNGYGASVIIGPMTYGGKGGLYELAVIKWKGDNWELCYDTEITNDVLGYLSPNEVKSTLHQIKAISKMPSIFQNCLTGIKKFLEIKSENTL